MSTRVSVEATDLAPSERISIVWAPDVGQDRTNIVFRSRGAGVYWSTVAAFTPSTQTSDRPRSGPFGATQAMLCPVKLRKARAPSEVV